MGAKSSAGSWMFSTSTSAQRLGWSMPTLALALSQMALAVASEWLPSPMAKSITGVSGGTSWRAANAFGSASACNARSTRAPSSASTA